MRALVVVLLGLLLGSQAALAQLGGSDGDVLEEARKIIRLDERAMPDKYRSRSKEAKHEITTVVEKTKGHEQAAPLKQCRLDIDVLWRNDVGSGVISAPLVADVEG